MESFFTFLICLLFFFKKKKSQEKDPTVRFMKNCNQVLWGT